MLTGAPCWPALSSQGELAYASSAPSNAASPSANQLRQIVTNDKVRAQRENLAIALVLTAASRRTALASQGELKFAALAPDVARSEKLSSASPSLPLPSPSYRRC